MALYYPHPKLLRNGQRLGSQCSYLCYLQFSCITLITLGLLANVAFCLQPSGLARAGLRNQTFILSHVSTGQMIGCDNYLPLHLWRGHDFLTLKAQRSRETHFSDRRILKRDRKRRG